MCIHACVCVFCDNAIIGSVSGTEAAVDNTQASCSCCLSINRLGRGWLNATKTMSACTVFPECVFNGGRKSLND